MRIEHRVTDEHYDFYRQHELALKTKDDRYVAFIRLQWVPYERSLWNRYARKWQHVILTIGVTTTRSCARGRVFGLGYFHFNDDRKGLRGFCKIDGECA